MSSGLKLEIADGVATITLDRADRGNAIDLDLARALLDCAIRCDTDETIRCVLLTGAGRMFCVGGDIGAFATAGDNVGALIQAITAHLHAAIATLARMPKPLITAVNGAAAGAGLSLAILGDIAIASADASFTLAYPKVGLSPDGGATWLLPRLIGLRRTQEVCLRGTRLTAAEGAEIGLVTRTVGADALLPEASALAAELATGAVSALGATRRLLLDSFAQPLEMQMELERRSIAAQAVHPEGVEGVAAFLAKRRPDFVSAKAAQAGRS